MLNLTLTRTAAFGNGTRNQGFIFGTLELEDKPLSEFFEALDPTKPYEESDIKSLSVELADGVTVNEFNRAIVNNISMIEFVDPNEGSDEPEVDEAVLSIRLQEIKVENFDATEHLKNRLIKAELETAQAVYEYGEAKDGFAELKLTKNQEEELLKIMSTMIKEMQPVESK